MIIVLLFTAVRDFCSPLRSGETARKRGNGKKKGKSESRWTTSNVVYPGLYSFIFPLPRLFSLHFLGGDFSPFQ